MDVSQAAEKLARPLYTYAEADRLAGVSRGTARRWLEGYSYRAGQVLRSQPPVTRGHAPAAELSFLDLVEIVAIGRLKSVGFPLVQIRQIVLNCQEFLGIPRPLVRLKFKTSGKDIFVPHGEFLLEVGLRKRMTAWRDVLEPFLAELDYSDDWAGRWWPLGKQRPVVIDPDFGFGLPVVAKSGVRTEILLERFQAGDLNGQIAADFNLKPEEVERALQFELSRAA